MWIGDTALNPVISGIAERLIPAALSAPLAYRTVVLFAPWIPVPVRRTTALAGIFSSVYKKPGIKYAYRFPSVMCPPDYPFRQDVPARLTREYCQAEKILLMG